MNRALLVGINAYPGCPLNGCINDILDMSNFLVNKCGFQRQDIELLTDQRATTVGIESGLRWLINGAKAGDRLLFHYSGHGAQMPLGGVGNYTGIDDVICPVDFNWDPNYAISDKYFHTLFSLVPSGVEFVWISDSCHSGDLDREISFPFPHRQPRLFPIPADMMWRLMTTRQAGGPSLGLKGVASANNVALIAGCKSNQTSADAYFNGRYNGALTYWLLQELNKDDGLKISLVDLVNRVETDMKENQFEQDPQLQGIDGIEKKGFLQV